MNQYWIWYLLGLGFILGIKFSFYMHKTDPFQSYIGKALGFFGADGMTFSKSVLCILAELALGSVYVNSLPMPYGMLGELPKDSILAVFFGAASEMVAPLAVDLVAGYFKPKQP